MAGCGSLYRVPMLCGESTNICPDCRAKVVKMSPEVAAAIAAWRALPAPTAVASGEGPGRKLADGWVRLAKLGAMPLGGGFMAWFCDHGPARYGKRTPGAACERPDCTALNHVFSDGGERVGKDGRDGMKTVRELLGGLQGIADLVNTQTTTEGIFELVAERAREEMRAACVAACEDSTEAGDFYANRIRALYTKATP